jgi:hypothetical protein
MELIVVSFFAVFLGFLSHVGMMIMERLLRGRAAKREFALML